MSLVDIAAVVAAVVVSVATFGVAMALAVRIYQRYQTLEEDELRMRLVDIGPEK